MSSGKADKDRRYSTRDKPASHERVPERLNGAIALEALLRTRIAQMSAEHRLEIRALEDRLAMSEKMCRSLRSQLALYLSH